MADNRATSRPQPPRGGAPSGRPVAELEREDPRLRRGDTEVVDQRELARRESAAPATPARRDAARGAAGKPARRLTATQVMLGTGALIALYVGGVLLFSRRKSTSTTSSKTPKSSPDSPKPTPKPTPKAVEGVLLPRTPSFDPLDVENIDIDDYVVVALAPKGSKDAELTWARVRGVHAEGMTDADFHRLLVLQRQYVISGGTAGAPLRIEPSAVRYDILLDTMLLPNGAPKPLRSEHHGFRFGQLVPNVQADAIWDRSISGSSKGRVLCGAAADAYFGTPQNWIDLQPVENARVKIYLAPMNVQPGDTIESTYAQVIGNGGGSGLTTDLQIVEETNATDLHGFRRGSVVTVTRDCQYAITLQDPQQEPENQG